MAMAEVQEDLDPFGNGKLPSGRHGLSREVVVRSQRERMVEAMISVVAMKGYTETTVADIISTAGVSRATFYEQFADKEDCFIAAYGTVMERMLAFVAEGFSIDRSDDWVTQIRGGVGACSSISPRIRSPPASASSKASVPGPAPATATRKRSARSSPSSTPAVRWPTTRMRFPSTPPA